MPLVRSTCECDICHDLPPASQFRKGSIYECDNPSCKKRFIIKLRNEPVGDIGWQEERYWSEITDWKSRIFNKEMLDAIRSRF